MGPSAVVLATIYELYRPTVLLSGQGALYRVSIHVPESKDGRPLPPDLSNALGSLEVVDSVAGFVNSTDFIVEGSVGSANETLRVAFATASLFTTVGVEGPGLGAFSELPSAAVLGRSTWKRLGGVSLPATLSLHDHAFTIVAIVPDNTLFPSNVDAVLGSPETASLVLQEQTFVTRYLDTVRLKEGHTRQQLQSALDTLSEFHPSGGLESSYDLLAEPLASSLARDSGRSTGVLAATSLLLAVLVGCAASYSWRTDRASRDEEFLVRRTTGASPKVLLTERLLETASYAALATFLAALLALITDRYLSRQIERLAIDTLPAPETAVALLIIVVAVVTWALATAALPNPRGRTAVSGVQLVVAVALSLALVITEFGLVSNMRSLMQRSVGFTPSSKVFSLVVQPRGNDLSDDRKSSYFDALSLRLQDVRGVRDVAFASPFALTGNTFGGELQLQETGETRIANATYVSPGFFSLVGLDVNGAALAEPGTAVVSRNASIASIGDPVYFNGRRRIVTATVPEILRAEDSSSREHIYLAYEDSPIKWPTASLLVRVENANAVIRREILEAVSMSGGRVVAPGLASLDEMVARLHPRRRLALQLLAIFSAVAIIVSFVCCNTLVAQSVLARRKELAIRAACGAPPIRLALEVLTRPALILCLACILGVPVAQGLELILRANVPDWSGLPSSAYAAGTLVVVGALTVSAALGLGSLRRMEDSIALLRGSN